MGWSRVQLRAPAFMTNGTTETLDFAQMRGVEAIIVVVKNIADANTLSAARLERKDLRGTDGYQTIADASESGDTIASAALNANTSGTAPVGRTRIYAWPNAGCPWNRLRYVITAGGTTLGGLSVDVLFWRRTADDDRTTWLDA